MTYLKRMSPSPKQIEIESKLRGETKDVKMHIWSEDHNNTYCNSYAGIWGSKNKQRTGVIFDDRWRLVVEDDVPSYHVCNSCLKRLWRGHEDRIKEAHDIPTPKWSYQ